MADSSSNKLSVRRAGTVVADLPESLVAALPEVLSAIGPMAVAITDPQQCVVLWSAGAESLFGWRRDEVMGRTLFPSVLAADKPFRRSDDTYEAEVEVKTSDDRTITTHVVAYRIAGPTDVGDHWVWVSNERANRQQAESVLALTKARFEAYMGQASDIVVVVKADNTITFVSSSVERVLGYRPDQLVGRKVEALGARRMLAKEMLDDPDQPRSITARRTVQRVDGTARQLEIVYTDLTDDPAVGGVVLNITDVTERVDAESGRHLLAQIVASTSDAITSIDLDGRYTSWNAGAQRILGWTSAEVVGRSFFRFAGLEADAAGVMADWDRFKGTMAAGQPVAVERGLTRRDGSAFVAHVTLSPLTGNDGGLVGVSAIVRDVTTQKDAELQLARHSQQQQVVAELGQQALEGAGAEAILQDGVDAVCRTLDLQAAFVILLDAEHEEAVVQAAAGLAAPRIGRRTGPVEHDCLIDRLASNHEPVVSHQLLEDPDLIANAHLVGIDVSAEGGPRSAAVMGLEGREGLTGALVALDGHPGRFGPADVAFLQAVAHVLVTAVERTRVSARMRHAALHDALTGLPNRALLVDRVQHALSRQRRHDHRIALLFVDLDRFKRINDTLGHHVGDDVLIEVGRRIEKAVRVGDTVARLGGDEFVVLCESVTDEDEATQVARRILGNLDRPLRAAGRDLVLTASIGIAVSNRDHGVPDDLLRDADIAMYHAKEQGRARLELFDDRLRDAVVDRLEIEQALRRAPTTGELAVVYQPQIHLETGKVTGVEALVRWHHPERGLLAPDDFVGVAEDLGLIDLIGNQVLLTSCRQGVELDRSLPELSIAVNLSPRQLADFRIVDQVANALQSTGLAGDRLVLEITETALLEDRIGVGLVLGELRRLGVRISIDDFGTGYSSLAYLTRMPVDEVKIDRSFISGLGGDPGRNAIVAAVIAMAKALGLQVVAEGVERPDQLAVLRDLGCDCGQGWLWSPARSLVGLQAWLTSHPARPWP